MEPIQITNILYLVSAIAFILGIKRLSHPKTARSGNLLSSLGMLIAVIATLTYPGCLLYTSPSPRDRTRSRMPSSA